MWPPNAKTLRQIHPDLQGAHQFLPSKADDPETGSPLCNEREQKFASFGIYSRARLERGFLQVWQRKDLRA
jgi:hypothetical protein